MCFVFDRFTASTGNVVCLASREDAEHDDNGDDDAYCFSLNDRSAGPNASNNTIKGMCIVPHRSY